MTPITLQNLANGQQITSAASAINANNAAIITALENTLDRRGSVPNSMQATLDMNNQQIINLPAPSTINSPVRLIDVQNGVTVINNTSSGLIDINTLSSSLFVTDGVTSNIPMFQSLAPVLQGVNREMPIPVNITVGTPTILSLNPTVASGGTLPNPTIHFLKPNQAFYFTLSDGGSLPEGISLNTLYYITSANLLSTTFTFSTVNNYGLLPSGLVFTNEGATVNTTGSLTGTLSIVLTGRDVSLLIPPGPYFGGNFGDSSVNVNVTPNGMTRVRYFAYGATFDTKTSFGAVGGPLGFMQDPKTWAFGQFDYINTTPNDNNLPVQVDALITLQTPANAVNYYVGQWISIFGLNVQDAFNHAVSGPPNCQYQEFKQIKAINTGTGVLTLDGPLKWVYLSTFPHLFTPSSVFNAPGNASIAPMHPAWDCDIQVHGARWVGQPTATAARRFMFHDCTFQGYANSAAQTAASVAQSYIYRNCTFGPDDTPGTTYSEIDKMLEYLEFDNCFAPNKYRLLFSSPSLQVCRIKGHQGAQILGTPREIKITDSRIDAVLVGPFIGVTDTCDIQNTRLTYCDMQARSDDPIDLLTGSINLRPGNDMTLVPNWTFSNGTFTRNISSLPGNQGMLWQIPGAKLYMIDASGIFKPNQNMGSPFTILNTYMDGSGNFSFDTTLSAVPTRQTSSVVTITNASPGVVSWAANGLANGTPVCFTTTGVLPLPLLTSTVYYVVNDATNTFQVASTVGGAAINTTTGGSGTHMAFANPLCFRAHPCSRFTGIGNSGSSTIIDHNGSIDEPMFSRVKRVFVGKQSTLGGNSIGFQQPSPKIWGQLTSDRVMRVNVIKAGVGAGQTLTISSPGFTQPNLALSNFSQVIDTTVAGTRVVTNTTATGPGGSADIIAAYSDWIAGPLVFTWTSPPATLVNSPIVMFEMFTDQGITRFGNMLGAPGTPASGSFLWQYIDSGIIQQFGSLP